jgi:hypothetical protein
MRWAGYVARVRKIVMQAGFGGKTRRKKRITMMWMLE